MQGRLALLVLLVSCLLACKAVRDRVSGKAGDAASVGSTTQTAAPPAPKYPDTTDGLKSMVSDMLAAAQKPDEARAALLGNSLAITEHAAWFGKHFDTAAAGRLLAEYAPRVSQLGSLPQALAAQAAKGRTQIVVERFTNAEDDNATGLQSTALTAMTTPVALYSVRMVPPGKASGFHLFNFVHDGESFRFVGKLTGAAEGPEPSAEVAAAAELRNKDRKVFFDTGKLPEE